MSFPEPIASISTPLQKAETDPQYRRPRRHTITRPDSAMGLLSDLEDLEDEDEEQQKTFDRISGILSNLIQEANEAVNGIEKERAHLTTNRFKKTNDHLFTSSTIISTASKIPRPRKARQSITPIKVHSRNPSSSTVSSTSTLVTSPTAVCRSPSPTLTNFKKQLQRHSLRPRSCPLVAPTRRSMTPVIPARRSITPKSKNMAIIESYKRLDTSMAVVDSLSRDLATPKNGNPNRGMDTRLTVLLLIPLLHIPHSLITMVFDFFLNQNTPSQKSSTSIFNFTTMVFWACVFTVTNLMVDQALIPSTRSYFYKVRRMSLPGTFKSQTTRTTSNNRTWIPTTIQKQYQFRLGEEIPSPQKRRNSI